MDKISFPVNGLAMILVSGLTCFPVSLFSYCIRRNILPV